MDPEPAPTNDSHLQFSVQGSKTEGIDENAQNSPSASPKQKSSLVNNETDEAALLDKSNVVVIEDGFGVYIDEHGTSHNIKRFTFINKNKIQVQVINYGARVISIKLPDRNGNLEDIILGFDDLAGYIFYQKYYFGATVGRIASVVKNSNFILENRRYPLTANNGNHHTRGGVFGLDQVVWDTYRRGNKILMTHLSPHLTEGYPGNLLITVSFELSPKNEFKIETEARTTSPTKVDISNILYFNLAGHHKGPDEIYNHVLTLNCNCFTQQVNGVPTGEIANVLNTEFDFQVPRILGKLMGRIPKDGFYQNLCVNRGVDQDDCFVARVLHPPSGRMIEIYSNQPGVCLNTVNDFGYGRILTMQEIKTSCSDQKRESLKDRRGSSLNKLLELYRKVHSQVIMTLQADEGNNFEEITQLIEKIKLASVEKLQERISLTPLQTDYVSKAMEILCDEEYDENCNDLKNIFKVILDCSKIEQSSENNVIVNVTDYIDETVNIEELKTEESKENKEIKQNGSEGKEGSLVIGSKTSSKSQKSEEKRPKSKTILERNDIPLWYQNSDKIVGKGRAIYKMHGALSLETQNYPNSSNFKNFPDCTLIPGEIYKHTVTYKFWVRAGNPNKWIKKNLNGLY